MANAIPAIAVAFKILLRLMPFLFSAFMILYFLMNVWINEKMRRPLRVRGRLRNLLVESKAKVWHAYRQYRLLVLGTP